MENKDTPAPADHVALADRLEAEVKRLDDTPPSLQTQANIRLINAVHEAAAILRGAPSPETNALLDELKAANFGLALANAEIERLSVVRGLSEISDEDLLAELHARRGRFSPDEYMSPDQSDDRAKLGILRTGAQDLRQLAISLGLHETPLGRAAIAHGITCDKLDSIAGNPLPARAFPVNTTLPGRESEVQK